MNHPIALLILMFYLLSFNIAKGQHIIYEGTYFGKNIYIMNPKISQGNSSYCLDSITINRKKLKFESKSSLEIDLADMNIELGEKIEVALFHKTDCLPKILTPLAGKYNHRDFVNIELKSDGQLSWSTHNEIDSSVFIVEQFKWNKWVPLDRIEGKGNDSNNSYLSLINFHSGENRIRIKQECRRIKPRYSKIVLHKSEIPPITFKQNDKHITFSDSTLTEIYNKEGELVIKKFTVEIDFSEMPKGIYYINYDSTMEKVKIK